MKTSDIHTEPQIEVGILSGCEIRFSLPSVYRINDGTEYLPQGTYTAALHNEKIQIGNNDYSTLVLSPEDSLACFSLEDVCIGIHFHWERRETQAFEGNLKFIINEDARLTAVNQIPLERYLYSVIASEMKSQASLELLKAHAVISRSWLLAQLKKAQTTADQAKNSQGLSESQIDTPSEHIRWYEREAHTLFDVCADDHCQRYQGIRHADTPQVREALKATRGMVLTDNEEICDTRFYKCCGGMTERFETCWDNRPKSYLVAQRDILPPSKETEMQTATNPTHAAQIPPARTAALLPDLRNEEAARTFILDNPPSFCRTADRQILSQVLNDYDLETKDFYRWTVRYSVAELSEIVRERSGVDFGEIQALEPVERSRSGRLVRLKIVGSLKTLIIGKELEIRKFLSKSHLYSAAFVVDKEYDTTGHPTAFVLHGAGWGHGVGLCQIGAAVMSAEGYSYQDILQHYYPHTQLQTLY